ncbi:hypothetical protein EOA33_25940 [Mesorhizobium sp. M4A.F.Ca.ET.050.02.1.1]|uniref:ABC transporter permease subunit n=1 Tax=Mesorhizobium sp. M4A.F.Ca.ET.050.02.1.1 TaxID=2496754 RepID=UPI000FCB8D71|nr:hypothetical protein [Mesorhizobium sp. M4A.F.Ca.ET.050.02.1.1]RUX44742.1 hypothetical protein EOA33_25940 [Mesorhizobium sp. M4A.F.Ca.ET.050.02.1.1]
MTAGRFGYRVQARGSNPEAAAHAGIATGNVWLMALALMGAIAGLAGVVHLGAQGTILSMTATALRCWQSPRRCLAARGCRAGMAAPSAPPSAYWSYRRCRARSLGSASMPHGQASLSLAVDWLGRIWRGRRAERRQNGPRG